MKHSLTNKDKAALTADCSVCGTAVAIARNGKYGFVCREGRKAATRRYKQAHPDRVREQKNRPASKHRLTKRDGTPDTCAVCGPVEPKPMGRGYGCPNRAVELGWKVFPEAPQPRCLLCRTFLDRMGACPKCDDDFTDLDEKYLPAESRPAQRLYRPELGWLEGFAILNVDAPYVLDERPADPSLKVIGSHEPWTGVKPEYAKLYGSGSR